MKASERHRDDPHKVGSEGARIPKQRRYPQYLKKPFGGAPTKMTSSRSDRGKFWKFFNFFGLQNIADSTGGQYVADCPFSDCHKEEHFFFHRATGKWDCKVCGRTGNAYTFMNQFYNNIWETYELDYSSLMELRPGISAEAFEHFGVIYSPMTEEWLLPAYGLKGNLVNLYAWRECEADKGGTEMKVLSAPMMSQVPFGLNRLHQKSDMPLWVAEGQWDCMAWWSALSKLKTKSGERATDLCNIVGLPGSSQLNKEYASLMAGRDVRLLMDNDEAGRRGVISIQKTLSDTGCIPSKIGKLSWPEDTPDKYDIRDVVNDQPSPQKVMKFVTSHMKKTRVKVTESSSDGFDPNVEPVTCDSFSDLIDDYRDSLHMNQVSEDVVASMLAVSTSLRLGDVPVWMYVVGASSSGKSTLSACVESALPYAHSVSRITGIFSGMGGAKKDLSLVDQWQGKTVVFKDFTVVLTSDVATQDRVFSDLRDLYDGSGSASYRNGVTRSYKGVKFGVIACTTDRIHAYNKTGLGERFLKIQLDTDWSANGEFSRIEQSDERVGMAMDSALSAFCATETDSIGDLNNLKCRTWGFLEHIHNKATTHANVSKVTQNIRRDGDFTRYIQQLSFWVSYARANVDRDRDKELIYRPKAEQSTRLAKQLLKTAVCLCLVYGIDKPDENVRRVIRKIALDTGFGFPLEIMLYAAHNGGFVTIDSLRSSMNLGTTKIKSLISNQQEIGALNEMRVAGAGRKVRYLLSEELMTTAKELGFTDGEEETSESEAEPASPHRRVARRKRVARRRS